MRSMARTRSMPSLMALDSIEVHGNDSDWLSDRYELSERRKLEIISRYGESSFLFFFPAVLTLETRRSARNDSRSNPITICADSQSYVASSQPGSHEEEQGPDPDVRGTRKTASGSSGPLGSLARTISLDPALFLLIHLVRRVVSRIAFKIWSWPSQASLFSFLSFFWTL